MKILLHLSFFKRRNKNTMPKLVSGFTLVELLVTISMFVIITGVLLVNSNQFDSTVLLNNFAYDVALTIKQAQSYGVNVKESSKGAFNSVYGVYFDIGSNGGSKTNFELFDYTAVNSNDIYSVNINDSCSITDSCVQKYTMRRGTYIQSICAKDTAEGGCTSFDKLIIMFQRPSLEAKIMAYKGTSPQSKTYVKIILAAANGATSTVVVTSVGQIYVKNK